jgi:hypothetical protein
LSILPGLVRYDEVEAGAINHAIRFTAHTTQRAFVWPARHFASSNRDANAPAMGQRFRLKSDVDIAGYPTQVKVILQAMKAYGLILADNGSPWYISGAPDSPMERRYAGPRVQKSARLQLRSGRHGRAGG